MFERFSTPARRVVKDAQMHARQLHHPLIGTEHLLLALLDPASGTPAAVLREAGIDPERVRAHLARRVQPAPGPLTEDDAQALRAIGIDLDAVLARLEQSLGPDAWPAPAPAPRRGLLRRRLPAWSAAGPRFGPRAKKVLELSLREALALRHNYIGAEHILLGLLREGQGLAARILFDAGLDLKQLRRAVLARMPTAA